jgi:hypothetical protein
MLKKSTIPGRSPPSATPRNARTTSNPAYDCTKPMLIPMTPHTVVSTPSHIRGETRLSTRFDGTSAAM